MNIYAYEYRDGYVPGVLKGVTIFDMYVGNTDMLQKRY